MAASLITTPIRQSGALAPYEKFHVTPVIGTEFPEASLVEMLNAPNSDDIIRDLAIELAERGVIFFRKNTDLTAETHKELMLRLGELSGRPKDKGLFAQPGHKVSAGDPYHHRLDTSRLAEAYDAGSASDIRQSGKIAWHMDGTFVGSDYTSLRMTTIPSTGGDTLWASAYEVYERFSKPYQTMLESLTCQFQNQSKKEGSVVRETIDHPVIRTHPVTGWKAVMALGLHCKKINGVTSQESTELLNKIHSLVMENHDIQLRFRWINAGDMAIWDNRCAYHAPTGDQVGARVGWRITSVSGMPYYDPASTSRSASLAARAQDDGKAKATVAPSASTFKDEAEVKVAPLESAAETISAQA